MIMTRVTSDGKDLVFRKAERVNQEMQEFTGSGEPVTLSVGIAFSDREMPGGDVFQDADTALRRMKDANQTGFAIY